MAPSKPVQARPSEIAWICLVLFVRIGAFQRVTEIPNRIFSLVLPGSDMRMPLDCNEGGSQCALSMGLRSFGSHDTCRSDFQQEIVLEKSRRGWHQNRRLVPARL